ncbi:hypothetical protein NDU88_005688 [Pleurodeles waltl]|uniref:Uncharacterized protein n=1 Tax=Pleurodeles waltl TaxID=8319 RepID=A0AAV7RP07_PLEWA|nr:hypothetical protein NDU88_005688 [Pleurodeles waltl]
MDPACGLHSLRRYILRPFLYSRSLPISGASPLLHLTPGTGALQPSDDILLHCTPSSTGPTSIVPSLFAPPMRLSHLVLLEILSALQTAPASHWTRIGGLNPDRPLRN